MAHPNSEEVRQKVIDSSPFEGLRIDDSSILSTLAGRHPCPKCSKSRKYFCYTCYVPITELEGKLPKIKLPLKIDIIKHKHEIDGKSTAAHAAILAPDDVSVYTYPEIPNYDDENVVLIFPSFHAIEIRQLFEEETTQEEKTQTSKGSRSTLMKEKPESRIGKRHNQKLENLPIKKAVFIDSTWNQSRGIYKDERIKNLQAVVLQNRISQFWRHQKGSPRWYLATIEAIHQFLLEVHLNMWGVLPSYKGLENCFTENSLQYFSMNMCKDGDTAYNGQYDNLLYFFHHMYDLIHAYYDHEELYAYKRRLQ